MAAEVAGLGPALAGNGRHGVSGEAMRDVRGVSVACSEVAKSLGSGRTGWPR